MQASGGRGGGQRVIRKHRVLVAGAVAHGHALDTCKQWTAASAGWGTCIRLHRKVWMHQVRHCQSGHGVKSSLRQMMRLRRH